MKCTCYNCKTVFDITDIVEPIVRQRMDELIDKIFKELNNKTPTN